MRCTATTIWYACFNTALLYCLWQCFESILAGNLPPQSHRSFAIGLPQVPFGMLVADEMKCARWRKLMSNLILTLLFLLMLTWSLHALRKPRVVLHIDEVIEQDTPRSGWGILPWVLGLIVSILALRYFGG